MLKIILIILFLSFTGCTGEPADTQTCCSECVNAYSQSPVAYGPTGARCGHFTSGSPMSNSCSTHFENISMTVVQCERVINRQV